MDPNLFAELRDEYLRLRDPFEQVRLGEIVRLVEETNQLSEGDYVEVGVHLGGTLKLIHRAMDPTRQLYAFDTFDGFDQRDLDAERNYRPKHGWRTGSSTTPARDRNFSPTSVEIVLDYLNAPENLHLVCGWFPQSFKEYKNTTWRFAHIDVDLYQPTYAALELIWPHLVPSGSILVHDYGVRDFAARDAIDHWTNKMGVRPEILDDRNKSALLRKPV